jgi:gluconate 2-dehydrogenase gamma chain
MSKHPSLPTGRRGFIRQVVTATGSLPLAPMLAGAAVATAAGAQAQTAPAPSASGPLVGYISLSSDEAAFVEALVTLMCPADDLTPNGVDSGLAAFIDRQLAGDFGRGSKRYSHGPWQTGRPQQGYQLPLTPEQYFKAGIEAANAACSAKYAKPFDQISAGDAGVFLDALAAGKVDSPRLPLAAWFNELVYPLFTQACFADPIYGGNVDKVFWKMIGYPGLPATNTINMVQYRGKPFPGAKDPKSMADFS